MPIDVELLTKPGCHLCDDARAVVVPALAAFGEHVVLREVDILEDDALFAQFADEIPVVRIDGNVHTIWRVDPARLTAALTARVTASPR